MCWALIVKTKALEDREGSMSAAARTDTSENRTEDTRMHDAAAASEDWASSAMASARQEREPRRRATEAQPSGDQRHVASYPLESA